MRRDIFGPICRTAVTVAVIAGSVWAQGAGPLDQRIVGQRIHVPPISERITVSPLQEGLGAFSATRRSTSSRILGVVINDLGFLVPSAGVVLIRSLRDGNVIGTGEVDPLGSFAVSRVEPGMYSAELVNSAGSVLTSSPAFTVGLGEIVQLTPVIPQNSIGGLASLIGTSTAGAVNSAVSAGVIALDTPPEISPVRTGG